MLRMRSIAMLAWMAAVAASGLQPSADGFDWNLPKTFPPPRVPVDNPMTAARVELGRHLFYDTRLSGNGQQACARRS